MDNDQAKLNDKRANPAFRYDENLDSMQSELKSFFKDLESRKINITNFKSYSMDPLYV